MKNTIQNNEKHIVQDWWQQEDKTRIFSKKAINKICQTLQYTGLQTQIRYSLEKYSLSELNFFQSVQINNLVPKIIELLFAKSNGFVELTLTSVDDIIDSLVKSVVNGRGLRDIIITIGLGATETLPSVRIPAYIIPAIKLLKSIKESELRCGMPTIRLFKANYAGIYVNNLNENAVKTVSEITFSFLRSFLDTFYPDYSKYFVLESDKPYKTTSIYPEILYLSEIIKETSEVSKEVDSLMLMGEKHGGKEGKKNSLFYAAAHPIYNQSISFFDDKNQFIFDSIADRPNPSLIIDLGGRPQRVFNTIITSLRNSLSENKYHKPPLVNIIIKSGKIPVYYCAKDGDIMLNENFTAISNRNIDNLTITDYELIFNEIEEYEYLRFIHNYQNNHLTLNNHIS